MASPTLIQLDSPRIYWPAACKPELADLYCLGRLSPLQAAAFEEHYLGCPVCARRVAEADEFIAALRAVGDPVRI